MIKDLSELKKFLALCRKHGVQQISYGDVAVTFGDLPQKKAGDAEESEEIDTDEPTPEQMAFFSVGGGSLP